MVWRTDARIKKGYFVKTKNKYPTEAKRFGKTYKFGNLNIVYWDGIVDGNGCTITKQHLVEAAEQLQSYKSNPRSDWETPLSTWSEIGSWTSVITGKRIFDSMQGLRILEATTSNGHSTKSLRSPDFGFKSVVDCKDFYNYSVKYMDTFDAIITNPPWDSKFLKPFYKFLRFLQKPFIIILRSSGVRHNNFQKVFGDVIISQTITSSSFEKKKR